MDRQRFILAIATLAASAFAACGPANAAVGFRMVPQKMISAKTDTAIQCGEQITPAAGPINAEFHPLAADFAQSKSSAILGGQVSRLELIAQQQSSPSVQPSQLTQITLAAQRTIEPGLGKSECTSFAAATTRFDFFRSAAPATVLTANSDNDNFLASKRLAVQHTGFDSEWNRVRHRSLPRSTAAALFAVSSGRPDNAMLLAVNGWANGHIRYVEDRVLYGKADYWADATSTIKRGAGDCEDIAIAKMQLLAAMGVSRSDMYLTIARDLVRNADHAVLVVKLDHRNWLLDNATDQVLDASASYDYRPILSFSDDRKWLHGY